MANKMKNLLLIVSFLLLCSCAKPATDEQIYSIDPMEPIGFKEKVSYTWWNKFWLSSAIFGQTTDTISTAIQTRNGNCIEVNTIYGRNPNIALVAGLKVLYVGGMYFFIEHVVDATPLQKQQMRNVLFAPAAILGVGATAWNMSIDCN